MEKCACCGEKFEKKAKGYNRTEIRSRFKGTGKSVAEVLHNLYDVTITPNKDIYIFVCNKCTAMITNLGSKHSQVQEAETRFQNVRLAGGYIDRKIRDTPTHTSNFSEMQKTPSKTPKSQQKSKSESVIYEYGVRDKTTKVVYVNNTKLGNAIEQMAKGRYLSGLRQLLRCSKCARSAAVHIMQDIVRSEAKLYAKLTSKNVINLQSLIDFDWDCVIKQAQDICPALLSIVTASLTSKKRQKSRTKKKREKFISMVPQIGSILNIIAFHWFNKCSVFQQMNSLMMWEAGCKRKMFSRFNRLGVSMSFDSTRRNIENYKQDYDTKDINWNNAVSVAERNAGELEGDLWEDVELEMHIEEAMDTIPQISDDQSDTQSSQLQELQSEDLEPKTERNAGELEGDLWEDIELEMHIEEVMDPQISDDQSDTQSSQLQELQSEDLEPKIIAPSNKQNRKRKRDSENDPSSIEEDDIKSSTETNRKTSKKSVTTNRKTSKKSVTTNGKTKKKLPTTNGKPSTDLYCHWLMKSEPESRFEKGIDVKFGIEDLKLCENETACWDGVRNYQARNLMRDKMKIDHHMFFYHSNCKQPGIAGICKIVRESYPDHTQFDSKDPHYDSSSEKDNPKWFMVDVKFVRMLKRFIPLSELKSIHLQHKADGGPLENMALFTRARLSVQPVTKEEWDFIISLENEK